MIMGLASPSRNTIISSRQGRANEVFGWTLVKVLMISICFRNFDT
jgi:hypothetical protein